MIQHSTRVPPRFLRGFTLIEVSIVLVIIALIAGGILIGRNLISAAAVRAQISQIQKYQQAVNTFRGKYGYLPGDLPPSTASAFGFNNRTGSRGRGDGNGLLEAYDSAAAMMLGFPNIDGELGAVFWNDLSAAKLVEGNYSASINISDMLPVSTIDNSSYINVFSGGWKLCARAGNDGKNYFLLAKQFMDEEYHLATDVSITTAQAYAMDSKIDDSLPQHGKVLALVVNPGFATIWANGANKTAYGAMQGGVAGASCAPLTTSNITPVSPSDTTCYDTRGNSGVRAEYSTTWQNGTMPNCSLSFEFN